MAGSLGTATKISSRIYRDSRLTQRDGARRTQAPGTADDSAFDQGGAWFAAALNVSEHALGPSLRRPATAIVAR
ncbi:hypothetical protein GCM10022225_77480 [Plantactinospora mayteni]|uniref:Uncharacterized protein n=1 Tax=Plantactinospora mayteni TaxID=566021 RepID=A0ABQ4F2R5_9ACTN|nr:hypothetical protein Pma05_77540 [Plantactinospora mayteni]